VTLVLASVSLVWTLAVSILSMVSVTDSETPPTQHSCHAYDLSVSIMIVTQSITDCVAGKVKQSVASLSVCLFPLYLRLYMID